MQAQTLSKNARNGRAAPPRCTWQRARGAHVWDVDGNRYVDFPMALGPIILGHAWPAVNAAIARQLPTASRSRCRTRSRSSSPSA